MSCLVNDEGICGSHGGTLLNPPSKAPPGSKMVGRQPPAAAPSGPCQPLSRGKALTGCSAND